MCIRDRVTTRPTRPRSGTSFRAAAHRLAPGPASMPRADGGVAVRGPAMVQLHGAGDEGKVAECLRRVAQLPVCAGIPFLAQESDVVAQAQEPLEQDDGLVPTPGAVQSVHEPERAREEDTLAPRKTVLAALRPVAQHETVLREVPLDGLDRADDATVVGGQEADSRNEQQARVEVRACLLYTSPSPRDRT